MKFLHLLPAAFVILISSCEPNDPPSPTNRDFQPGPNLGQALTAPDPVYCPRVGRNCYLYMQEGDWPVYSRQIIDNFYADYTSNNISRFFSNNDWRILFPSWSTVDEDVVQKIISNEYCIKVYTDSSIVILKDANEGLTIDNVVYALDRVE